MSLFPYGIDGKRMNREKIHQNILSRQKTLDNAFLTFPRNFSEYNEVRTLNGYQNQTTVPDFQSIVKELDNLIIHRQHTKAEIMFRRQEAIKVSQMRVSKKSVIENENPYLSNQKPDVDNKKTELNTKVETLENGLVHSEVSENVQDNQEIPSTEPKEESGTTNSNSNYAKKYQNLTPVNKFIRAIKTINLLLKATTTNIEQSKKHEKKYLTFTDIQGEIEPSPSKYLAFNLADYKAKEEKTLGQDAINVLRKHKSLRTPQEIRSVVLALTDTVEIFSEFPISMQESLVVNGWYEKYNPKQVIIREGHPAQNYYFIISGLTVVSIMITNPNTGESFGTSVAFLKKGQSFGEMALMSGGKRNASVICINHVELLSVTQEDFIQIFMNLSTNEEPKHIQFLRNVKILEDWPIDIIPYGDTKICLFTFFRRGTVLCKDSNNSEWVYIICSGTCKIIKGLKEAIGKHYKLRYSAFKIEGTTKRLDKAKEARKMVYIQLKVLVPRDVFGLESVAFELLDGTSSVTLVSDGAECIAINKRFFCKNMSEKYLQKLRREIQPFPEEDKLVVKLQNFTDWKSFRREYTNNLLKY